MADFTIDQAKTYFKYEIDDPAIVTEFTTRLGYALLPAKSRFQELLDTPEYLRYERMPVTITATSKSTDNITFSYDDSYNQLKIGEKVTVDSKKFQVVGVGVEYFVIDLKYSGAELEFTIDTLTNYNSIFAWIVLYELTTLAKEFVLGIIQNSSKQFGSGNVVTAFDPVKNYRKEIEDHINIEFSVIKRALGLQKITYLVRS